MICADKARVVIVSFMVFAPYNGVTVSEIVAEDKSITAKSAPVAPWNVPVTFIYNIFEEKTEMTNFVADGDGFSRFLHPNIKLEACKSDKELQGVSDDDM